MQRSSQRQRNYRAGCGYDSFAHHCFHGCPRAGAGARRRGRLSPAAPGTTSNRCSAMSACGRPVSAWRSAGSCSAKATGTSPPRCCTRRRPRPRCRCRWPPSTTRCISSPTSACCDRSPSTAPRPTSTPTSRSTIISSSKARTTLLDIPQTDVIVGKTPVPPEGYEIARIDVVVRLPQDAPLSALHAGRCAPAPCFRTAPPLPHIDAGSQPRSSWPPRHAAVIARGHSLHCRDSSEIHRSVRPAAGFQPPMGQRQS